MALFEYFIHRLSIAGQTRAVVGFSKRRVVDPVEYFRPGESFYSVQAASF
jgi:hypothetical protein